MVSVSCVFIIAAKIEEKFYARFACEIRRTYGGGKKSKVSAAPVLSRRNKVGEHARNPNGRRHESTGKI